MAVCERNMSVKNPTGRIYRDSPAPVTARPWGTPNVTRYLPYAHTRTHMHTRTHHTTQHTPHIDRYIHAHILLGAHLGTLYLKGSLEQDSGVSR